MSNLTKHKKVNPKQLLQKALCIMMVLYWLNLNSQIRHTSQSPVKIFPKYRKLLKVIDQDITAVKKFPKMDISGIDISKKKPYPKRILKMKIEAIDYSPAKRYPRKIKYYFRYGYLLIHNNQRISVV